jgi:Ca2+-binding EF-hand superfamily protein
MNANRKKIVALAFKKLDKDSSGWIDLSDIKGVYNAARHPDVLAGKKTED